MGTVNYSMFSHSQQCSLTRSKYVLIDRAVIGPAIPEDGGDNPAGDDTVRIFGSTGFQP